ncbi:hypothetical protein [Mycolicibacterium fortuitum]|uniref:hypothetical protein n=1 Tax=Mycolicibacterium fortuitum TaxID=1766 RepID=UPI002628A858|nr:hypothetical protein [Mycolicibacterium fortuitum]
MANPAQLLHDQLISWRGPQTTSASQVRQAAISDDWLGHRIAVRHLDAIDELLNQMTTAGRNVRVYRGQFPNWCAAVFAYPSGWQGQGSAQMNSTALDHLESLADRLIDFVPTVKPGGLEEVREYVESIRQLLDEDQTITDPNLIMHVKRVIAHLMWCVDNYDAVGDFDLQEALERLAAAVVRAGAASGDKERWRGHMDRWVWPFGVNAQGVIPATALGQLALGGG